MSEFKCPLLNQHGDADKLCTLAGSQLLQEKASSSDKTLTVRQHKSGFVDRNKGRRISSQSHGARVAGLIMINDGCIDHSLFSVRVHNRPCNYQISMFTMCISQVQNMRIETAYIITATYLYSV